MALNLQKPYSASNPVPKVATDIRSIISPSHATNQKAKDTKQSQEESHAQSDTKAAIKGKPVRVRDPTTGEDVEVKNADADGDGIPDGDVENRGKNILETKFPPPGV